VTDSGCCSLDVTSAHGSLYSLCMTLPSSVYGRVRHCRVIMSCVSVSTLFSRRDTAAVSTAGLHQMIYSTKRLFRVRLNVHGRYFVVGISVSALLRLFTAAPCHLISTVLLSVAVAGLLAPRRARIEVFWRGCRKLQR